MADPQLNRRKGVVLVGHGGVPKDYPYELVRKQKQLETQREASGGGPSPEELALDKKIRDWPRTPETDPYKAGLESLGAQLGPLLKGTLFKLAYNEFCSPSLEGSIVELISLGAREITVIPSMLTPGGSHSEREVPQNIEILRSKYPDIKLKYAWPFDLSRVSQMLADQLSRF